MAERMGNPQILFLKEKMKAICRLAKARKAIGSLLSPKRRRSLQALEDDIRQGKSCSTAIPKDVPKGHCAVYIGSDRSRFIIPTTYLNHSLFKALLEKAEEEYGFEYQTGLTIPCDEVVFRHLTTILRRKKKTLDADKLIDFSLSLRARLQTRDFIADHHVENC